MWVVATCDVLYVHAHPDGMAPAPGPWHLPVPGFPALSSSRARPLLLLALATALTAAAPLGAIADGNPDPVAQAVLLAKKGRADAARRQYEEAAGLSPVIAEWLILRAAVLTPDSLEREALYARIELPVVRAQITRVEAETRERLGDLAGAAVRYDSLGQLAEATRLRLRQARTEAQRQGLRSGLLSIARQRVRSPEAADAIRFLASSAVALTPQEGLECARLATEAGLPLEAALLYSRALRHGAALPADQLAYGRALASLRRHREAITAFRRMPRSGPLAAAALYGEAWSRARLGQRSEAERLAGMVLSLFPDDSAVVARALYLQGSLAWDAGRHLDAREPWLALVNRFPAADSVGRAGFLAALALYEEGQATQAAAEWQRIQALDRGTDGQAAGYWAGRAWESVGDSARSRQAWGAVLERDSSSYYAYASATRLGSRGWTPPAAADRFTVYADVEAAMERIAVLRAAGLATEATWERNWLLREQVRSPERLLAVGDAFRRRGDVEAGIASARVALTRGAPRDARSYRLLYPRHHDSDLIEQAQAVGVDPLVVAALIRQESAWNPTARSRVGARGLMQVMPATGRLIARQLGVRGWRADHLDEPALNLRFGTFYLGQVLQRFNGDLIRALAAYNAGPGRVPVWSVGRAADDPELFIERIGFRETRDYVRIIQRNLALYRALYPAGTS